MTTQRLFAAQGPGLAEHQQQFGALPESAGPALVTCLAESGLTGRGGAGFPTGRKIASVSGRKPVVIGNGAEGEPLSSKDVTLLARAPHLVLDGLTIAANAVAADSVFIYVPQHVMATVQIAVDERVAAKMDRSRITIVEAPDRFVAGEESAVVSRIEGGPALPRDRMALTTKSGVRGRPTLVNNVETLAHIALIARYGAAWFRSVGDTAQPGTMLVTLSGTHMQQSVVEVPTGSPLQGVIATDGRTDPGMLRAVLLGGYHGGWIPADALAGARLSRNGLAALGASPGAGIVHALRPDECGLERTAEIAGYLADQGARQCGPCLNGLPRLSRLLDQLAYGRVDGALVGEIRRMLGLIDGRGSCRHPDGTARLVRTALAVFRSDITRHQHGRCEALLAAARREIRGSKCR
jgi:NADH:ubiquinone oxidoreductase subunit F (NADH-binding)